jgi:hypothetical protein
MACAVPSRLGATTQDKMNEKTEIRNMALFCDFENVALGVRDAKYAAFDIWKVLERLLLKGSIVDRKRLMGDPFIRTLIRVLS